MPISGHSRLSAALLCDTKQQTSMNGTAANLRRFVLHWQQAAAGERDFANVDRPRRSRTLDNILMMPLIISITPRRIRCGSIRAIAFIRMQRCFQSFLNRIKLHRFSPIPVAEMLSISAGLIAGRRISQLLHRLLDRKGPRPLARWKLLEAY